MASIFDQNFEKNKSNFKTKFGINWNDDPSLYMQYLQTLYIQSLTEITNTGLGRVLTRQEEITDLLQSINKKTKE